MRLKRILFDLSLIVLFTGYTCVLYGVRLVPHHNGVDPQLAPYVNEYLNLAKIHGIKFDKTVGIGFSDIKEGAVVGIANYGIGFQEIDIDSSFWDIASPLSKIALVWHELSHSYCDRKHDYKKHPYHTYDTYDSDPQGFFKDRCPKSLMFPVLPDDVCSLVHFNEYENEMFENCKPY